MSEWSQGEIYESYVGRWSRLVAAEFVGWLEQSRGLSWLDVGCGTGALTSAVLASAAPRQVVAVDPSEGFVGFARGAVTDERVRFGVLSAAELGGETFRETFGGEFDVVVSGLVLNFVPERIEALRSMREIGTTVAVYVWDYAEGMQLMKYFWDAAADVRPQDRELDEGKTFPFCNPAGLEGLFAQAGFSDIETGAIVVPTVFESFDAYWTPFLGGQGVAPAYLRSLDADAQEQLRALVKSRLPTKADGSIELTARAWSARGTS
ncbi:class I SAM-dependent methyltransferase [Streptomyces sp. SID13031]|uniref:class I SAM-dependent methyltransferase n=1 Tax=Streptomyces sp. SID13031 TaxID=2706046 RepID=UPI0013C80093|nr:class I SAM-dependent methyltransferase [Streptomyces sp. SID13031]NEA37330.1 class I SAM-dependent methyltransferase [Streptomyces sp. SID13031]